MNQVQSFNNLLRKPPKGSLLPPQSLPVNPPPVVQNQPGKVAASTGVPSNTQPSYTPPVSQVTQPQSNQSYGASTPQVDPYQNYLLKLKAFEGASRLGSNPQFEQAQRDVATTNKQLAEANAGKRTTLADEKARATMSPGAGDFVNNNLSYKGQLADTKIGNVGLRQGAANQTLQTQLAILQAEREGRVAGAQAQLGAAAPNYMGAGLVPVFPISGSEGNITGFSGSNGLDNFVNNLAQQVKDNKITYEQAVAQIPAGSIASAKLTQALGPDFNRTVSTQNTNSQADRASAYNAGKVKIQAADNLQPSIVATLKANPTLNATPISAITNLNQWFSGQTSQPEQQQLSKQVAAYIQALGLSPDTAAQIAVQRGGTIGTLLETLRSTVEAQNNAYLGAGTAGNSGAPSGNGTRSWKTPWGEVINW